MASFETLLDRLARRRGWDSAAVAEIAGDDVTAPEALRRLAPALGWRTADLFALADQDLPDDLAPTDWVANPRSLIWNMVYMPSARPILLAAARSMPQLPRTGAPARIHGYPDVPSAVVGRLLNGRNLHYRAALLLLCAGGPYISESTVVGVCRGKSTMSAQFVVGFARGLDIAVEDLALLCEVDVGEPPAARDGVAELADFMWECRRLTGEQLRKLEVLAHELRHRFADEIDKSARCGCGAVSEASSAGLAMGEVAG